MQDQQVYSSIEHQVQVQTPFLKRVLQTVFDNEVSSYPILVMYTGADSPPIGIKVYSGVGAKGQWSIHLSTLEEFVFRQLIQTERVAEFQKVYKNPEEFFCVFSIVDEEGAFLFIPQQQ